MSYSDFLAGKESHVGQSGKSIDTTDIHPLLHSWQAEIVSWALSVGRAAIWADTGLGKTFMQLEWLRHAAGSGQGLIVAPLAVCHQTIREATRLGIELTYTRETPHQDGLYITNYEMVPKVAGNETAVVLDESSILKSSDGKTRTALIEQFSATPYRLACTATPAPNDPEELTNHAEFLGHMARTHMLAAYFVHDDTGWRLKGHAHRPMMQWMASWAIAIRSPSDIGYPDDEYILPGLNILTHLVDVPFQAEGQLFATDLGGVGGRSKVRHETMDARVDQAASIVNNEPDEPWLMWCGLNKEAEKMAAATGAVNVHGSMSPEDKAESLLAFADGRIKRLVTKPSLASFGLNWQHCARMVFVGLSDSYETYYQSIRRCYRYGQTRQVDAHIVLSEMEAQISANVQRKEREAGRMTAELVKEIQEVHDTGLVKA